MALAEARAAWQRTANRCLVQEDAKMAPKLACCSSATPSVKQAETGRTSESGGQDIPIDSQSFALNPSYSNLSPSSRWWLQLPPNYGYQKGLMDEQVTPLEGNNGSVQESSTENDSGLTDKQCRNFVTYEKKDVTVKKEKFKSFNNKKCSDPLKLDIHEDVEELMDECLFSSEVSKDSLDLYFDSESSWVGVERNTPWWRTADTEELALLVAQRSLDPIENCDLPRPLNNRIRKDTNANICCFGPDEISTSSIDGDSGTKSPNHLLTHDSTPSRRYWPKLRMSAEDELMSGMDKAFRVRHKMSGVDDDDDDNDNDDDASKAQLLEALCHSQTRAREAEEVAKQACAEKDQVVKLVFRQASQLFAYKQWLQLLQLENMCFQYINNKSRLPVPWTPLKTRRVRPKSSGRKRVKRCCPWYDVGKCAVAFALGLGLVGAGLLLGWTIGWMLPMW